MMGKKQQDLPLDCGDGLVCRWGRPDDAEALAEFNLRIHSDNPDSPETFLVHWTRDLMSGKHPTTTAADFTVVVNERDDGRIVSSMNLISQKWAIEDISFGVGRPELVGTDEMYRRRGLVRTQFAAIHAKSAARGELMQIITGIPWYYRQFGYEMAINLGGSRKFIPLAGTEIAPAGEDNFQVRPAAAADLPLLTTLYAGQCAHSLFRCVRDADQWRYGLFTAHPESPGSLNISILTDQAGAAGGYVEYQRWGQRFVVRELAVNERTSLRAAGLFLLRHLQRRAQKENETREKPINQFDFALGEWHPVYDALRGELSPNRKPYAYFVRIPDLPVFFRHIAPLLNRRLAEGGMAGYTGSLRLNFFQEQWALQFETGNLVSVASFTPKDFFDSDAFFPALTFLQLVCGYRSFDELDAAFADCYAMNNDAAVLLRDLFPKRPSYVRELS
jgi:hypothetical protein